MPAYRDDRLAGSRRQPFGLAVLVGAFLFMVASCSHEPPAEPPTPSNDTRIDLANGPAIGFHAASGAKSWLGLPYAEPPVGDFRWRAPRPLTDWSEERVAIDHPAWCAQITTSLDELELDIDAGQIRGSEDCLYLSVHAPADAQPGSELPIMVWIHGGSNMWGRAEQYDGSVLAERHDVVVVMVQYRLGPFGFFHHEALRDGSNGDLDGAANFAVLDLIEALRWVKANGAVFGGDPGNVTVFGESAGAQNIYALIVSPLSEGLFQQAIVQSGNPRSTPLDRAIEGGPGVGNSFNAAAEDMTGTSDPTAGQLRALSTEEILGAILEGTQRQDTPTMVDDGVTIPADGIEANLAPALQARRIPIIMGSNREEAKYLLAFNPEFTKKRFGFIITPRDKGFYDAAGEYLSGAWRALTLNDPAQGLAAAGVEDVYTYRFDWDGQGSFWFSDISYLIGSSHMVEIPFVFGAFDHFLGTFGEMMFDKGNAKEREALAKEMMTYWSNFARHGNPGAGISGPEWPSLTPETASGTLVLDGGKGERIRVEDDETSVSGVVSAVRSDPRLDGEGQRCTVASALAMIFGSTDERFAELKTDVCDAG